MEIVIRGSEYQDFLNCRKKWYYSWVEGIEPVRPDNKLFIGTVFHKWLEIYYSNECNKLQADMETSIWFNKQDVSGMESTDINELTELVKGMADYYHKTYGELDKNWNVIATELKFIVKLQDDMYMTGTIDLVYEVNGKVRFADHKTVSSLSMYEEKAKMDRQISRYWWALDMLSKGIARVWDEEKQLWVRFEPLIGKEIDGFDYNLIAKDVPKEPKVLKNGTLSTDKAQKTTYAKYVNKLIELGENPHDHKYGEILATLMNKPNPFLRRINVLRTQKELESSAWEFMYTSGDIHDVKLMIKENPSSIEAMTYRNIGTQCEQMCQFRELCKTTIEGGNVSLVKNLAYRTKKEEQ